MTSYRIGRLDFTLTGAHPVAALLRHELAPNAAPAAPVPLTIEFRESLEPVHGATCMLPLRIVDDAFTTEHNGLSYRFAATGAKIDIQVRPLGLSPRRRLAPDVLLRPFDWNHLTPWETIAKNFLYDVFDYSAQLAQLRLGQSWLHASAFERDGAGVAVIGWGGMGKTTVMLKLVLEEGWRFLSDDLVAIDEQGTLWRSPKRLQVYGYNVAGQPRLRTRLLQRRSPLDRAAWELRRSVASDRRVRRRIAAETLFGDDAVAVSAPLREAILIERVDARDFSSAPLTPNELARRAAMTLLHELQPVTELSIALHASGRRPAIPSVHELLEQTRSVLERAFEDVQPHVVGIPAGAGPDDVTAYLRGFLDVRT